MDSAKFNKGTTDNNNVSLFRPISSVIVLVITTLQNLKQFTTNEYNVKDSFSFCKQILDQDTNLFIKTFDNQSLFTNIPLDETTDICVNMVFEKRKKVKGMLKRHFKQLLIFFVKTLFYFQ